MRLIMVLDRGGVLYACDCSWSEAVFYTLDI